MTTKPRILVIDDEKIALNNLMHVLKKEGYNVTGTQSGQRALKYIETEEFDLVLTDLKMEKVDGMQILKLSRKLHPDTEVVMITGFATVDSAISAMKAGAYHYIAKPFKLDEVRKVSREALEKIAVLARNIKPDRIQLNTATRPPAEAYAFPLTEEGLESIAGEFGRSAEVVAGRSGGPRKFSISSSYEDVLNLIRRRPCFRF